jgi:hypothetical protein
LGWPLMHTDLHTFTHVKGWVEGCLERIGEHHPDGTQRGLMISFKADGEGGSGRFLG